MKVISKTKAILVNDREGKLEEFIQIEIKQTNRDAELKEYTFETIDSLILNKGLENESVQIHKNRHGQEQIKTYVKSYEDYDSQKELLLKAYQSDLIGSELDDYLLLCALMYNLQIDPIYGVEFEPK